MTPTSNPIKRTSIISASDGVLPTSSADNQTTNASITGRMADSSEKALPMRAPHSNQSKYNSLSLVVNNTAQPRTNKFSVSQFLSRASQEATFSDAMTSLLEHLSRSGADECAKTLSLLQEKQSEMTPKVFADTYHFKFTDTNSVMPNAIEFKSVFDSEEWSNVMLKGIAQSPQAIKDKDIVDVGCGNFCFGRAALAHDARSAMGTDINPDAVLNAKLNQVLLYGKAKEEVVVSDLLSALIKNNTKVDTIIACIPQILCPDAEPDAIESEQLSKASLADRERHSHQAPPAGGKFAAFDPYGLGLVARLLKQAPQVLKPGGQLLMNVAGRPGQPIIDKMFEKFNTTATPVVTEIFAQQTTGDERVDLSFFVAQERKSDVKFNFYTDQACTKALNATEAQESLDAGQCVYHSLTCYHVVPKA